MFGIPAGPADMARWEGGGLLWLLPCWLETGAGPAGWPGCGILEFGGMLEYWGPGPGPGMPWA